jgi:hypothetical protein
MTMRLVDTDWGGELATAFKADSSSLRIICPFIKVNALNRLLTGRPCSLQVITRFNLDDFVDGVSDIAALRSILEAGGNVRGIRGLHAKLYLFGVSRAIVTSANLTGAALDYNREFGVVVQDIAGIATCHDYFDRLWRMGAADVTVTQLDEWVETVNRKRAAGGRTDAGSRLGDFGANAGIDTPPPATLPPMVANATQAFVKFLGESSNRVPLSCRTAEEIERAGCHRLLAYPTRKRPRSVKDDALMLIARLTDEPDIRIFGRAIGMRYVPGRDDATLEDIARRSWRGTWSRYIRIHQAEFVAGTMANGVSLKEFMETLGPDSFSATQRNAAAGAGNTNPRRAFQQAAAVELSQEGLAWLRGRLQAAFDAHGTVPRGWLDSLV